MIPILQRTSEYLRHHSPTQPMLKFLDIVLKDIQESKFHLTTYPDLPLFFLDQLNSLVDYISYCLYEDIFPVFEKLLALCQDILPGSTLRRIILALIDKYTMKSKTQKQATQSFMKLLIDSSLSQENSQRMSYEIEDEEIEVQDPRRKHKEPTYFEVMLGCCFFQNSDRPADAAADLLSNEQEYKISSKQKSLIVLEGEKSYQFKTPQDLHELYLDKLQFFIDSLSLLEERHVKLFHSILLHPGFKRTVFRLLDEGETNLRLKCHEILETVATYLVTFCNSKTLYEITSQPDLRSNKELNMIEVEYINPERLFIAQMMLQCVRRSFEMFNGNDSYLQFNSLILLDYLF